MQTMTKPFPSRKASSDLSQLQNQRHPVIWDASVLLWYIWKQWSLATQSVLWEREYQSKRQRRWHLTADPRCWTSYSCSVTKSCPTLCDPMDCSTPGFPVFHYLLEFAQTQVHWVGNAIQPSCSLSPPFPPAFNLSQHRGLFQWVGSLHQVAKVLELQLQHQSFQWLFRVDSFWIDWLDFLAVQRTLKSLL